MVGHQRAKLDVCFLQNKNVLLAVVDNISESPLAPRDGLDPNRPLHGVLGVLKLQKVLHGKEAIVPQLESISRHSPCVDMLISEIDGREPVVEEPTVQEGNIEPLPIVSQPDFMLIEDLCNVLAKLLVVGAILQISRVVRNGEDLHLSFANYLEARTEDDSVVSVEAGGLQVPRKNLE